MDQEGSQLDKSMDQKTKSRLANEYAALEYHFKGRKGKIEVVPTKPCSSQRDLSLAYTPGVAVPCLRIQRNPQDAYKFTAKGNLVAVISNGTAVLGLGNIGALAGKPVMEGKGVLFKKFADIDVFDIEIDTTDPDEFIRTVKLLEPTFGGINLEDIKAPECFQIERELEAICKIPVFHDDQHGTAIISSAALLNALEVADKKIDEVKVVFSGAGAAGISCAKLHKTLGVRPENLIMCDIHGVVYKGRKEGMNPFLEDLANDTDVRTLAEAIVGADVFVGVSVGGVLSKDMIASMNKNPIVFALANPDPEIDYPDAVSVRDDLIMATGRSDYPNQVNNVLGFPFIFRGALDVQATHINMEMKVAAIKAIAALAKEQVPDSVLKAYGIDDLGFGPNYIIPKPFDHRVLLCVAPAVARAAMDSGVAQSPISDFDKYLLQLEKIHGTREFVVRQIINRVKKKEHMIVFPEGVEEKVLKASYIILEERIATPVLLGNAYEINHVAEENNIDLSGMVIINPLTALKRMQYAEHLYELRQRRGIFFSQAQYLLKKNIYYAMMMLESGDADGVISGMTTHYPDTIRPALEILKIRKNLSVVSSFYLVMFKEKTFIFADTTVNIDPTAEQLSEIAINCAYAAKSLGMEPKIAMLSFSNFGSVRHPYAKKMAKAVQLVKDKDPGLVIDGEMQADTAISDRIIDEFFPFSAIKGSANVLIFPELQSANISYKLVEHLGQAELVGPILMGLRKPLNVISRGCSVDDIVNMAAITALEIDNKIF
ncbi:MAG: bifunctional malic enzyme oxidoreductase/phosphotransacetylase [bacterium]|nr:MAG: bifunctional malic enzyme oxidoreductase/phosphotransacetylase [bacterium]